jgi:hypothetical protein
MDVSPLDLIKGSPIFLISFLISLILFIIQVGYISNVLNEIVTGNDDIPEFKDIILYLKEGIKDLVLGLYYSIPILIIALIPVNFGGEDLYYIIIFILLILTYLFILIIHTAILYSVIDSYKKAFNIIYIFKKSREIGFKRLHFVLILSIIIFTIVSSIILSNNDITTTIILVAIGFFVSPVLAIINARYLALIGREIMDKKYL